MPNLRLTIDTAALAANWCTYARASGAAACGAAVKADGYGLGAREVSAAFVRAGCRELFVAHWEEAAALGPQPPGVRVAVLHSVLPGEMATALASPAVPVLNTPAQVAAWKAATDRPCDIMVDTGMNRLGLTPAEAMSGLLDGLNIDVLHSHLACADVTNHPLNAIQLQNFTLVSRFVPAQRRALASSAGVARGADYVFDLTRPGLGLYGGKSGLYAPSVRQVVTLEARIVQVRNLEPGDPVGYGATFQASRRMRIAVAAMGYADGYPRGLSDRGDYQRIMDIYPERTHHDYARGWAKIDDRQCPVVGRVSMDLTVFDVSDTLHVSEGDWLAVDLDLERNAKAASRSQYELLTGLGRRYARVYK